MSHITVNRPMASLISPHLHKLAVICGKQQTRTTTLNTQIRNIKQLVDLGLRTKQQEKCTNLLPV